MHAYVATTAGIFPEESQDIHYSVCFLLKGNKLVSYEL
jgi:hypothetical protein